MESSLRRASLAIAYGLAGAMTGGFAISALMPFLRQIDPLGLSAVALINLMGGTAFGWYLRGRTVSD